MDKASSDSFNISSSVIVFAFILLPALVASWPIIFSKLQDEYPDRVKDGNLLFMLFSPHLDRQGIRQGKKPDEIMKQSMKIGLRDMVDRVVNPAVRPLKIVQDTIGETLRAITSGIQEGITIPMRGMFELGTKLTQTLNQSFIGIAGAATGIIKVIHGVLNSLIAGTTVGLYMQATSFNLAISGIKFFLWIAEMAGIATTVAGGLMMLSLFTIIPGIILVTLGGILTGIAVESENVMRIV